MRITLLNQKGGVGKTTISLLLAGALQRAGYNVAIDDRDPQKSATFFANQFGLPMIEDNPKAETIITDTPGHLRIEGAIERELVELIKESDKLLLVTKKDSISIHGTAPMARLIKKYKRKRAKAYILFNEVQTTTTIGKQSGKEIAADLGLPALRNELRLASAYKNALLRGLSAITSRHRPELVNLALEIMK